MPYSSSFQVAVSSGTSRVPSVAAARCSSFRARIQPASANSAVHALVLGGEASDQLLALSVGVAGQEVADDLVGAVGLVVAELDQLVEARGGGAAEQVDGRDPAVVTTAAGGQ